jgi:lysophospholipase L1-like esterase
MIDAGQRVTGPRMGPVARRRPGGGPVGDPVITLARDIFIPGSSSISGNGDGSGVTLLSALAVLIDAAQVASTETVDALNYPIHTVGAGGVLHNWGRGGETYAQIEARWAAAFDQVASDDIAFLHIGDNGVTGNNQAVDLIYNSMVAMRALLAGTNPHGLLVNTRGGWNTGRTAVSESPGAVWYAIKEVLFRRYSTLEPGRVIDFFWTLLDTAAEYGLQDANDQADIDKALSPRGFMMTDGSHMGQHGYQVVARELVKAVAAIQGKAPWGARQFLTPQRPSTPGAGDVIGTAGVFGSLTGASAALGADNTQTDYAIAANGQITRIGATPPTRDLVRVPHTWSKSGHPSQTQKFVYVGERAAAGAAPSLVRFDGFSLIAHHMSRWSNPMKLAIVGRFRGAPGEDGIVNNILGGTNQCLLRRNATNAMDWVWRNSAATVIASITSASNLWRNSDGPRWCAVEIDVAASVARMVHWATPASATTVANGGAAQTALAAAPATPTRLDQAMGVGHSTATLGTTPANQGIEIGAFDIGPFYIIPDFPDFTLQATRELFCNSDGTPKAPPSNGVVGSLAEAAFIGRGNATDWRMCDFFVGAGSPNEFSFHHWKRAGDADRGYLTTV